VLHERAGVGVSGDADPGDEVEPVGAVLREVVLRAAVQGDDPRRTSQQSRRR
jgi:hypothetical protein